MYMNLVCTFSDGHSEFTHLPALMGAVLFLYSCRPASQQNCNSMPHNSRACHVAVNMFSTCLVGLGCGDYQTLPLAHAFDLVGVGHGDSKYYVLVAPAS